MSEEQDQQNPVDGEYAAADQNDHSYDSNYTHDSEVIFSLMIIS